MFLLAKHPSSSRTDVTVIVAGQTKEKMQHKTGQKRSVVEPREQAVYYRIGRKNIA